MADLVFTTVSGGTFEVHVRGGTWWPPELGPDAQLEDDVEREARRLGPSARIVAGHGHLHVEPPPAL